MASRNGQARSNLNAAGARTIKASVLASTALASIMIATAPAVADAQNVASGPTELSQTEQTQTFKIAAQSLVSALEELSRQTSLSFAYATSQIAGIGSPGVSGTMTPREALASLLSGTGVTYRMTGTNTAVLQAAAGDGTMLNPITVEGRGIPRQAQIGNLPEPYAGGQVARGGTMGMLGNRDVMDTPFNQTSYTADMIADQQARTLEDVVANDPSVRSSWPSGGYTNPLMIRGFEASNQDVAFDGLYGIAPTFAVGVASAERVEIFKGPNALLTGMQPNGSVGGGVNIVPKRADDAPLTRLTGGYLNDTQFEGRADIGRRFGDNNELGVRFNGALSDGETGIDYQERTFGSAALGADYRGDNWRVSADLGYQQQNVDAPQLITFIANGVEVPDAPDASSNWFFPWSWVDIDDTFGAVRGEYDITPDWTVYAAAGTKQTHWERLTYFPTVNNAAGDTSATPGHLKYLYHTDSEEVGVRGAFETGPVGHELAVSATRFRQRTSSASESVGGAYASNIYNPSTAGAPAINELDPSKTADTLLTSVAVGDVLSILDERVQLIGGVRFQQIETTNYSATTGLVTSKYEDSVVTPSVGLVFKPRQNVMLYANYIEGLQKGEEVGATYANAGETLAPYVSKQYEAGVKVDWGSITTTLSAFEIKKPSGAANGSNVYGQNGEQRNRGLELNVFGEVTRDVRVLGGVTFMDAELTKTVGGTNNGNTATGVPRVQVNLGAEWDTPFIKGLTLSGRAIYTGQQQLDTSNSRQIPDWTRFDIGLRYSIDAGDTPLMLRANIENVFDKDYWASAAYYPGYVAIGSPRTFLMSVSAEF